MEIHFLQWQTEDEKIKLRMKINHLYLVACLHTYVQIGNLQKILPDAISEFTDLQKLL